MSKASPNQIDAGTSDPTFGDRMAAATAFALARGAEVSITLRDRATRIDLNNGVMHSTETASISKLFIADDALFREAHGTIFLSTADHLLLREMLRSSDDTAAEAFWVRFGRSEIIDRIVARYGLSSTSIEPGDEWWLARTTSSDIVTYYSGLLDGHGGLGAEQSAEIVQAIEDFTEIGTDGYYQRFGIPDGLPNEPDIAVKQGWMCCIDNSWIHLTTGTIGPEHRYVIALSAREALANGSGGSTSGMHARETLTEVVAFLFPDGRVVL